MSSSSPFGGIRTFDADNADLAGCVDPVIFRDYVSNNLLHCADQTCARVLVNDMAPDDSYIVDNVDQFTTGGYSATEWRPIASYGPFPLSTRAVDGVVAPYRVRCAIYAAAATGSCQFAIQIMGWTGVGLTTDDAVYVPSGGLVTGENCVVFGAAASASPAWLTPSGGDGVTEVDRGLIFMTTRDVIDVPGSTDRVGVAFARAGVRVLAMGSGAPRIYGIHVAEVF